MYEYGKKLGIVNYKPLIEDFIREQFRSLKRNNLNFYLEYVTWENKLSKENIRDFRMILEGNHIEEMIVKCLLQYYSKFTNDFSTRKMDIKYVEEEYNKLCLIISSNLCIDLDYTKAYFKIFK